MPTVLHRAARRLTNHLGAHGSGLVLIAAVWLLVGLRALGSHPAAHPIALHQNIPPAIDAVLWFTGALLCLSAAFDRNGPRRDGIALGIAVIPPAIRMASFGWAWLMDRIPGAPDGLADGWYRASIYLCMAGLVWLVAAIPDEQQQPTAP